MTDKKTTPNFENAFKAIDPKTLFPFFNSDVFGEWFRSQGFDDLNPITIMQMHRDRLTALAQANEAAMSFYRVQLERQAKLFDGVIRATWAGLEKSDLSGSAEATKQNLEHYKAATDKAVELMRRYSEETATAAQNAYQKVSAEIEASVRDHRKS